MIKLNLVWVLYFNKRNLTDHNKLVDEETKIIHYTHRLEY